MMFPYPLVVPRYGEGQAISLAKPYQTYRPLAPM